MPDSGGTMPAMRVALSIAGSDPTGGAGLQADLQVFRSLGVHGAGVLTAITVQDTRRVHRVLPAFPSVVLAAGDYTAIAKHGDQIFERNFTVEPGLNRDVEVLLSEAN